MSEDKEIILPLNPKAAKFCKVKGWVSRNNLFFGKNEQAARYDGSTHRECNYCGKIIPKQGFTACDDCLEKKDIEKYNKMPKKVWDGEGMLYSDLVNEYFDDWSQVEDYCEDNSQTKEELRLIICEPNYACEIHDDYWSDDLPEDGELPSELADAFEELNKFIRESKIILSWSPGEYATKLDE